MQTNPRVPDFNFKNKTALITGGTRGIGLEIGLGLGSYGANCILTYSWGDHDEEEIKTRFAEKGAQIPLLVQADVINNDDTKNLLELIGDNYNGIDIFISNVSVAQAVRSIEDYSLKSLKKTISYSTWPLINYLKMINEKFERYPEYVIGISSPGPDYYIHNYDYVAASKGLMEIFCRYLSFRLREDKININIVRSSLVKTESFEMIIGREFSEFMKKYGLPDDIWIEPREVADVIIALCSGYCDSIRGQTITVDRGTTFFSNIMKIYSNHVLSAQV